LEREISSIKDIIRNIAEAVCAVVELEDVTSALE
jgi:hypothetical protein